MNTRVIVLLTMVFVGLLVYARSLDQRRRTLTAELTAETSYQGEINAILSGVQQDTERAKKLQEQIARDLGIEKENFDMLSETLENIQARLRGAEDLRAAVEQLRQEYEGFKEEAVQYNAMRNRRGH